MNNHFKLLLTALIFTFLGYIISFGGAFQMNSKHAFKTKEPLLIEGEEQKNYSLLPIGSVLYLDKSWPEGHETFHVYFHAKGDFLADHVDANVISPIWLRTVDREELPKLLSEYPLSTDELIAILKARKISKDEIVQILRDWPKD